MHLEILRGEGANDNALNGPAILLAVRALDEAGQPVAGALVVFSPPTEGPSVVFSGFEAEAHASTGDSGVAVAPRVRPVGGNGPVAIQVLASHSGEFANCVIHLMNLGVAGDADREPELDVVRLRPAAREGRKSAAASSFSVRVEDAQGRPVPLAEVLFVLRRVGHGGAAEEIARTPATADRNAEATAPIPKRSGNRNLEFMVQAAEHGRRATRYFRIDD
ncbi:MAG: hypothetical protein P4K98_07930 [Bryobacteraceae bacterium]|nr:hypothetical protein [Bryobacteraceae bacterium]